MNRSYLAVIAITALSGCVLIFPVQSFLLPKNHAATSNRAARFSDSWSLSSTVASPATVPPSPWFTDGDDDGRQQPTKEKLKTQILQLGAALDRGQSYNPTSGDYYSSSMNVARSKIQSLISLADAEDNVPKSLDDIAGEWELVLTTVKHGIFRSSPFFLAVQEAFGYAEEKEAFGEDKATLFFKLHELQTCSWGVSKIGRVAQRIDPKEGYLFSEFDTSIFSLTVIPILGWFKLLPTFGGCVVTASKAKLTDGGVIEMEVDYTTSRPVPGLSGLGEWIWSLKVPVGTIWKFLPWNKGRDASCSVTVKYYDEDFRVVEDKSGDLFVYSRPVVSRNLDV
mmetsp:Transcript_18772/g.40250  ORF Transcript_18772/g.40250 Transcript_18772/m.40250 type:complete len:338 (+) Transcript_18772:63-1076(+)